MTIENSLSKIDILIQQQKYNDAEVMLGDLLSGDPNNIQYLSLLAEVNLQKDNYEKATTIIDNAIGISPDMPQLFYIKSRILIQQDRYNEAEELIKEAIALDPYDADYFALLSSILLDRKKYNEALDTANEALGLDPENLLALNIRTSALTKLNRDSEARETIDGALNKDPNNAFTHANYGWSLLESGDHKKALEHFKHSLSSDPTLDYAQSGMLQAIKATNPVYRVFLKYAFWMSNLTAKYQWGVIIGFYLCFRALKAIAQNNEGLQPYLIPLIIGLAVLAFSTWVIAPISNLFLRFNRYGQLLLDRKERISSNFVALSFGAFLAGILLYFALSDDRMLTIAMYGFAMMLPFGSMLSPAKNKYTLLIYTTALAVAGLVAIFITFSTGELFNSMSIVFMLGFFAYQWVANYLLIREDNY